MKLAYYGQGAFHAMAGYPLLTDEFERWDHGPVAPPLRAFYHGWSNASDHRSYWTESVSDVSPLPFDIPHFLQSFVDALVDYFPQHALSLRAMTHEHDGWRKRQRNSVIPINDIAADIQSDVDVSSFTEEFCYRLCHWNPSELLEHKNEAGRLGLSLFIYSYRYYFHFLFDSPE